ncbi:MAG: hypothetical protein ACLPXW_11555 [Xanthobacteraceae bacterium]
MPLVLLLLGVVTTIAGLVLVGSGLIARDGTFETEVLTPGTIAAVGGLLLIAFGLAVRELRRIERVLAAPSTQRAARVDETSGLQASMPGPSEAKPDPHLPAAAMAAEPQADDAVIERLRAKIPTIPRVENGRFAEAADVSLALRETAGLEEGVAEVNRVAAVARAANGAAPVRTMPRIDFKPRPASAPDKSKVSVFNTFWPATAPRRDKQTAQLGASAPALPQEPRPPAAPAQSAVALEPPAVATAPVSVLKSGVVEGMAYTLYSDGSIEAQLPQGTLRFGSISALRNHIENSA